MPRRPVRERRPLLAQQRLDRSVDTGGLEGIDDRVAFAHGAVVERLEIRDLLHSRQPRRQAGARRARVEQALVGDRLAHVRVRRRRRLLARRRADRFVRGERGQHVVEHVLQHGGARTVRDVQFVRAQDDRHDETVVAPDRHAQRHPVLVETSGHHLAAGHVGRLDIERAEADLLLDLERSVLRAGVDDGDAADHAKAIVTNIAVAVARAHDAHQVRIDRLPLIPLDLGAPAADRSAGNGAVVERRLEARQSMAGHPAISALSEGDGRTVVGQERREPGTGSIDVVGVTGDGGARNRQCDQHRRGDEERSGGSHRGVSLSVDAGEDPQRSGGRRQPEPAALDGRQEDVLIRRAARRRRGPGTRRGSPACRPSRPPATSPGSRPSPARRRGRRR